MRIFAFLSLISVAVAEEPVKVLGVGLAETWLPQSNEIVKRGTAVEKADPPFNETGLWFRLSLTPEGPKDLVRETFMKVTKGRISAIRFFFDDPDYNNFERIEKILTADFTRRFKRDLEPVFIESGFDGKVNDRKTTMVLHLQAIPTKLLWLQYQNEATQSE